MGVLIVLGDEVVDSVSGFAGTVTSIVTYLEGTSRAYVMPIMTDYGCIPQEMFVETGRLKLKKAKKGQKVSSIRS